MRSAVGRTQPDPLKRWLIKLVIAAVLPLMLWPFATAGLAFSIADCDATYGCTVGRSARWILRLVISYPIIVVALFVAAWWCNAHERRRLAIGLTAALTAAVAILTVYFVVTTYAWF